MTVCCVVAAVVAANEQGGAAAPQGTPSQPPRETIQYIRNEVDLENIADIFFPLLPQITPLVLSFTRKMNARQLLNLEKIIRIFLPVVHIITMVQAGADGISEKKQNMLDELESYSKMLISFLQTRRRELDGPTKHAVIRIPDYIDLIDDHLPIQDAPSDIDFDISDVSLESVQINDNTPTSHSLQYNHAVHHYDSVDKLSQIRATILPLISKRASMFFEKSTSNKPDKRLPSVEEKHKNKCYTPFCLHMNLTSDNVEQSIKESHASSTPIASHIKQKKLSSSPEHGDDDNNEELGLGFFRLPGNGFMYMSMANR